MKSITIHKLDPELALCIEEKARREGSSLNNIVKQTLRQALGIDQKPKNSHRADFEEFCGTWTKSEAARFDKVLKDLDRIDPKDW